MKVPILAVLSSLVVGLAYRQVVITVAAWLATAVRAPGIRRVPRLSSVGLLERV